MKPPPKPPVEKPAVVVARAPKPLKKGCRHGCATIKQCETCRYIIEEKKPPTWLKWKSTEEYKGMFRRGRFICAEMDLQMEKQDLGSKSASLAPATANARLAIEYLHDRSLPDPDMTTLLLKTKEAPVKKEDPSVIMMALIFAAHYGELNYLLELLRKIPTGLVPAIINSNSVPYPAVAKKHPVQLRSEGKVQDNNLTYWPMNPDHFIEDTPLVAAARRDNTEHMLVLLCCGADPDAAAACGATALGIAAVSGFLSSVNVLLGLNIEDVVSQCKNYDRETRKEGDIKGQLGILTCNRSITSSAENFLETSPLFANCADDRERYWKLLAAHKDRKQCPATWAARWTSDVDLVSSVEMKHIGLALSRCVDRPFQGQRVEGTPLELAVRGGTMSVVDVLLRAGATTKTAKVGAKSLYEHIFDRTIVKDGDIEGTESKDDNQAYMDNCLASCLNAQTAGRLRTLAKGTSKAKDFENKRRVTQLWRLGVLLHTSGIRSEDFRGGSSNDKNRNLEPTDPAKLRKELDNCQRVVTLARLIVLEYNNARRELKIEPGKDEHEDGRDHSKVMKKNRKLMGDEMAKVCHFLALCRLVRLVRAKVANYTSSDALKAAADHIVQVARAALANKVSSGFPEPANFERELKKWIQATEAAAADMRTRAASSSSEYSPTEQWQDDWKPYDEVAKEPLLLMQEARGLVMFGSVEKPEADPDIELYLRYQTDECYGPDAEQPCAGFEGDDPGEETPAAPAPPSDKLPAPAPAAAKGPTPEEQAAAEAKKKAADEKKRADDEKKQAEAAEKQRADAARHQRDLEKKKAAEKRREEQRAQEREEAKRREERKKREEAKRRELTRRTNLWDPSRRKAGSAKRSEAEDLVRALPWTDLAAHFGVQEARGTVVELRETPGTALPGPLRPAKQAALPERDALYPVPEDDGRGMSGEAALVADRVLAWYAQRPDKWRQRCLEVLAELASGDEDARARAAHRKYARYGVRVAALDKAHCLIWSATLEQGQIRVLAWCCVKASCIDESCESIKEALERRADVKEDDAPYLTLGDDDVLIQPGKNRPMKLWTCDAATLRRLAKQPKPPARWSPRLRLTTRELGAVDERGAPAMVLGRSGTGKTHCIVERIARDAAANPAETLLFSTRSQKLRLKVEKEVDAAMVDVEGGANATSATRRYLTAAAEGADADKALLPFLEAALADLPAAETWHVSQPHRRRRFYRADTIAEREAGDHEDTSDEEGSDDSSDESDDGDAAAREKSKRDKARKETWHVKYYMTFAKFHQFWDGLKMSPKPECDFCWTQIQSFLKGSTNSLFSGEPLSEREYLADEGEAAAISRRRALGLSRAQREQAYQVFKHYERFLEDNKYWDAADREVALVQRVLRDGFANGRAPFDRVYVDEVQDMTQASLAVLLLAVGGDATRLYCCGDTAQAIQDGVAFRFSDLRETIYELGKELEGRAGRLKGARALLAARGVAGDEDRSKKLYKLTKNYRAHAGVLGAANAILELVHGAFPNAVDKTEADSGVALGPRPTFATDEAVLRDVPSGARLLFRSDALAAAQERIGAKGRQVEKDRERIIAEADAAGAADNKASRCFERLAAIRGDRSAEADAHVEEALAARSGEQQAYDARAANQKTARKELLARRSAWREEERRLRAAARSALERRENGEKKLRQQAERRRKKADAQADADAAAAHEELYAAEAQRQIGRHMAKQQAAATPKIQTMDEILRDIFAPGDAKALGRIFENEAVDIEAALQMTDRDFEDVNIWDPRDAARIRDLARRSKDAANAPPPAPTFVKPPKEVFIRARKAVRSAAQLKVPVGPIEEFLEIVRAEAPADDGAFDEARARMRANPTDNDASLEVPSDDEASGALGRRPERLDADALKKAFFAEFEGPVYAEFGVTEAQVREQQKLMRRSKKKAKGKGDDASVDAATKERRRKALAEHRKTFVAQRAEALAGTHGALQAANIIAQEEYGSRSFSVQEFKGLEDDVIVLVDFFGGAHGELEKGWRALLRAARAGKLATIDVSANRGLERDLKVLYTALTRPRSRLVVLEPGYGEQRGAAQDAEKFFLKSEVKGARTLAEPQKPTEGAILGRDRDADDDGTDDTVTADEWRSRGALNARIAAEKADDPLAGAEAATDRLKTARDCFAKADDQKLTKRCDASARCLQAIQDIRVHLDMTDRDKGHLRNAETLAANVVPLAVEAGAIDDALRVLDVLREGMDGDDAVVGAVVTAVEAVRDAALGAANAD